MLMSVDCPYCGEGFETVIEPEDGSQDYIEDCSVCCQPIEFRLQIGLDGSVVSLTTSRADD